MHTEVNVPNANYELVPGMYASVKIPLQSAPNVAHGSGASDLLDRNQARERCWWSNSTNHLERREVKLGLQSATDVEVLSGLKENELVVFGEQNQFKEGELVSPKVVEAPRME